MDVTNNEFRQTGPVPQQHYRVVVMHEALMLQKCGPNDHGAYIFNKSPAPPAEEQPQLPGSIATPIVIEDDNDLLMVAAPQGRPPIMIGLPSVYPDPPMPPQSSMNHGVPTQSQGDGNTTAGATSQVQQQGTPSTAPAQTPAQANPHTGTQVGPVPIFDVEDTRTPQEILSFELYIASLGHQHWLPREFEMEVNSMPDFLADLNYNPAYSKKDDATNSLQAWAPSSAPSLDAEDRKSQTEN